MNEGVERKPIGPLELLCKRMGEVYGPSARTLLDKIEKRQSLAKQRDQDANIGRTSKTLHKSDL